MRRLWVRGLTALFAVALIAPASPRAEPLRIALMEEWTPFSFQAPHGAPSGVLVALIEEIIVRRAGVPVEIVLKPWRRAQRMVRDGEADALLTFPSAERRAYALPTRRYLFSNLSLALVHADVSDEEFIFIDGTTDLRPDLEYCVEIGNGHMRQFYQDRDITPYQVRHWELCLNLVESGRSDVFVNFRAALEQGLQEPEGRMRALRILPHTLDTVFFALLVRKSHSEAEAIVAAVDAVLENMVHSGDFARVTEQAYAKIRPF